MKTAPAPSRRPRRPRAATARSFDDRMLAAMETLLAQGQAFNTLTVEQLTEAAGMARATFYLHCRDKGELVARLTQRLTTEIIESAGGWFRGDSEVNRATMHFALHGIVGTFKKHQAILVAISDTMHSDPKVAELHARMMDELCAMSRRAITQVKRQGRAAPGAPSDLGDLLTWFLELYCARFITQRDGRQLTRMVDGFAFVCGNAIFAQER